MIAAWLVVANLFTAVALLRLLRRERVVGKGRVEGVLLRPVDAPSPQEIANLAVELEGVRQVVLSPSQHSDPPHFNRKLGHLQLALTGDEPRIFIADADVEVDAELLRALGTALDEGADLAWAAPRPLTGTLSRGLLVQSLHSFEALDVLSGGAKPVCGKALALGPKAIAVLRALPDCLGEDLQLSAQLHRLGLRVVLAGDARIPVAAPFIPRFTRWMQVLRAHRPALFPTIPLLFTPTPFLLVAALLIHTPFLLVAALSLVVLRCLLAVVLERRPGLFLSWFPAEAALAFCWLRACVKGTRVVWRDRALQVGRDGRLGVAR